MMCIQQRSKAMSAMSCNISQADLQVLNPSSACMHIVLFLGNVLLHEIMEIHETKIKKKKKGKKKKKNERKYKQQKLIAHFFFYA